jgi:hypothetical protein
VEGARDADFRDILIELQQKVRFALAVALACQVLAELFIRIDAGLAESRIGTWTTFSSLKSAGPVSWVKSPSTAGPHEAEEATELLRMDESASIGTWRRQSKVSAAELQLAAAVMLL